MTNRFRRQSLLATTMICGVVASFAAMPSHALAADAKAVEVEEVVVTGSRVTVPGIKSASPIMSVGAEDIRLAATPELAKIIKDLPISIPGDGENVNNGTSGVTTINLRGLGSQRNLIMMNGRRVIPFNVGGSVDVSTIPSALIERLSAGSCRWLALM